MATQHKMRVEGSGTEVEANGVPRATGRPLLINTGPERRVREVGGAMPSVKSSRNELSAWPPGTEVKDEVSVLLKPNENVEGLSVVPPSVPLALASTATVGLGLPGNTQTGCAPHDTEPRFPSVDDPDRSRARAVIVKLVDVTEFVTVVQLGEAVHPVVTTGRD